MRKQMCKATERVCFDPDTTGGLSVLISAPQWAAMQVHGSSVLIPCHHAEGASSLSGDSNSMHHSPAEKTDACMRNWLSCQGGDSWLVNPLSHELEKCTHTHTHVG